MGPKNRRRRSPVPPSSLHGQLATTRQELGMTQAQLSERSGIPIRTIQSIEAEGTGQLANFVALGEALDMQLAWVSAIDGGLVESPPDLSETPAADLLEEIGRRLRRVVVSPDPPPFPEAD